MMPVVTVKMWEGKTDEQKRKIMKGIFKAFKEIDVDPDAVYIIIHDIPKTNWGAKGDQCSVLWPQDARA